MLQARLDVIYGRQATFRGPDYAAERAALGAGETPAHDDRIQECVPDLQHVCTGPIVMGILLSWD